VEVRLITRDAVRRCRADEIEALLTGDGLVWIDVQYWDADTARLLTSRLGLHQRTVRDCAVRNFVPKVDSYPEQTVIVLHAPERGAGGHVHYVELDQVVGPNWVLTAHGPMNDVVVLDAAYVETGAVARRLQNQNLRPGRPCELSEALVDALTTRLQDFLTTLSQQAQTLEQQVTSGHVGDAQQFLEHLFGVRHGLLAVQTMAVSSREVYGRMVRLAVFGAGGNPGLRDLEDRFGRIAGVADSQREYLQRVIEFHRTRTSTRTEIAAERLAVIAAVTLPIDALSGILGMHVIVYDRTQTVQLVLWLVVMAVTSVSMLLWARRRGWW
jgi:magnesium transporter